jgi:hypothetical protein
MACNVVRMALVLRMLSCFGRAPLGDLHDYPSNEQRPNQKQQRGQGIV